MPSRSAGGSRTVYIDFAAWIGAMRRTPTRSITTAFCDNLSVKSVCEMGVVGNLAAR